VFFGGYHLMKEEAQQKETAQKEAVPKFVRPHTVNMENCAKGYITGVGKVISSNENAVALETSMGGLILSGNGLKINKFDADTGTLSFEGAVAQLKYQSAKVSFWKRIFK
jgi:sporulation protein YabP